MVPFTVFASAGFESSADALGAIGVFRGSDDGYELDREPTRQEAAVMLIRLLGKEAEVLDGTYEHPFTDVEEWADKYIGYLYEAGITNGSTETLFEGNEPCDAQMYTVFMLRALGYTEQDGDYTYNSAVDFARGIGLVDDLTLGGGEFTRGNMAVISYVALATAPKDDDDCASLLAHLVDDGAIDAEAAQPILDRFATIAAFVAADATASGGDLQASLTGSVAVSVLGEKADVDFMGTLMLVAETSDIAVNFSMIEAGTDTEIGVAAYMTDGYMYMAMDMDPELDTVKMAMPFDISEYAAVETSDACPVYMFSSASVKQEDGLTVYTVQFDDDYLASLMQYVMDVMMSSPEFAELEELGMGGISMSISGYEVSYTVDGDGIVQSMACKMDMSMSVLGIDMGMSVNFTMDIDKYEGVVIEFPDFSDYEIIDTEASAPADAPPYPQAPPNLPADEAPEPEPAPAPAA